jgi:hypothetical protein
MKYILWFAGATAVIAEVTDTPWNDVLLGCAILVVGGLIVLHIGGWLVWKAFDCPRDTAIAAAVVIGILAFAYYAKRQYQARTPWKTGGPSKLFPMILSPSAALQRNNQSSFTKPDR